MRVPTVTITPVPLDSEDAIRLIGALDDDLRGRYPGIPLHGLRPADVRDHRLVFLVARADDEAIGCGAVRELEPGIGEVKRMFVHSSWRRRGVARQLLAALETEARKLGYKALRLETGVGQPEAIGLYRSTGYVDILPFGEYIGNPASVCFEKRLNSASRAGAAPPRACQVCACRQPRRVADIPASGISNRRNGATAGSRPRPVRRRNHH